MCLTSGTITINGAQVEIKDPHAKTFFTILALAHQRVVSYTDLLDSIRPPSGPLYANSQHTLSKLLRPCSDALASANPSVRFFNLRPRKNKQEGGYALLLEGAHPIPDPNRAITKGALTFHPDIRYIVIKERDIAFSIDHQGAEVIRHLLERCTLSAKEKLGGISLTVKVSQLNAVAKEAGLSNPLIVHAHESQRGKTAYLLNPAL